MIRILLLAALALPAHSADVCNPRVFHGVYGFQLSGDTRISGDTKPTASIGRLVFDEAGGISGYSSAQFAGYLQGNPTTGKYEAHTDCSIEWSLQDDSGNFQHFSGKMTPDMVRIEFHQSDPGGPQRGIMVRTPQECGATTLRPEYHFAIAGTFTPMLEGQEPRKINSSGTAQVKEDGKLVLLFSGKPEPSAGTMEVDSECIVTAEMPMKLRGILVDEGREILAIDTGPGMTVTAHFTSR